MDKLDMDKLDRHVLKMDKLDRHVLKRRRRTILGHEVVADRAFQD